LENLAQLGVLYVYLMLVILAVIIGFAAYQGISKLMEGLAKKQPSKANIPQPWFRLAFISGVILFLSIYSLGVLKTVGAGDDNHDHQAHAGGASSAATANTGFDGQAMETLHTQMTYLDSQLNSLEGRLNGWRY